MYSIEIDAVAQDQIANLPGKALNSLADVLGLLRITPWEGARYNQDRSDSNVLTRTF